MKKSIRFLSVIMTIAILLCVQLLPVSAARSPLRFGDANADYSVDITDATHIQRYLAKYFELSDFGYFAADVDDDGNVSIFDATTIQMKLAELIEEFPAGDWCPIDVYAEALVADYSSGKAKVGAPVTFEAIASGEPGELTYDFFIDGKIVQQGNDNILVHTFTQPGTYHVEFYVENAVGIRVGCGYDYEVVIPYETGWICIYSIYHRGFYDAYPTFEAIARDGATPYEFKFDLYMVGYATNGESEFETLNLVETQDYSPSNSFTVKSRLENSHDYQLTVYAKDSKGRDISENYRFTYELPPPA